MRRLAYFGLIVSLLVAFTMSLSPMTFAKTLKIGLGDPIDSDQGVLALRFKKIVETTSGGRYTVDIFPAGQLGDEQKYPWLFNESGDLLMVRLLRSITLPLLRNPWVS